MRTSLKWVCAIALTLGLSEVGACVAMKKHRPRGAIAAAEKVVKDLRPSRSEKGKSRFVPPYIRGEGIHPYLGFLRRRVPRDLPESVNHISEPELYRPGSALYSDDPNDLIVSICGGSMSDQFTRLGGAAVLGPLLAEQPKYAGRNVRFISLGGGGVKQPQQLITLEYLLALGSRIDVVINFDGFNEVALHERENERHGVSTVYPRNWFLRVERLGAAELLGERAYHATRRAKLAADFLDSPLRRLHVAQFVWLVRDRRIRHDISRAEGRLRSFQGEDGIDFVTAGPRQIDSTPETRLVEMVDIWSNSSIQLAHACAGNGIDYFHFLQPNQYVRGSKPLSDEERAVAIRDDHPYGLRIPAAYPRLKAAGEELTARGIRFHDLTQVFADHDEVLYKDDCCHVNELGNQILARAIADAIASWGD